MLDRRWEGFRRGGSSSFRPGFAVTTGLLIGTHNLPRGCNVVPFWGIGTSHVLLKGYDVFRASEYVYIAQSAVVVGRGHHGVPEGWSRSDSARVTLRLTIAQKPCNMVFRPKTLKT